MNEALDYRTTGMSYREIAAEMHISVNTAYTYVQDALQEVSRENAEQVLTLELKRYDDMLSIAYQQVVSGDLAAMDRALTIMSRIERLHGVEAPKAQDGATETAAMLNQLLATSLQRLNTKE
ncbi:sigma factor-like helix-turn-helix DNA-binding protein [Schaalia cardiffensis]|uniref:sigma factor-like helix-turn-helix DNA-binding protein n=1 Tax=Schaalia cardiffensis TaxID=181487 RepID=UPI0023F4A592|nr:sigma factor-like helix-turn-helix DNA-binding protein [Schaalia cardiffensis]